MTAYKYGLYIPKFNAFIVSQDSAEGYPGWILEMVLDDELERAEKFENFQEVDILPLTTIKRPGGSWFDYLYDPRTDTLYWQERKGQWVVISVSNYRKLESTLQASRQLYKDLDTLPRIDEAEVNRVFS